MIEGKDQHENGLAGVVMEIIARYQPIPTMDIWYELGEDDRLKDGIALAEVNEILSHLMDRKIIFRQDGDNWILKDPAIRRPTLSPPDKKQIPRKKTAGAAQRSIQNLARS